MTESISPFDTAYGSSDIPQVSGLVRGLTYQWDVGSLEWVKGTQPTAGAGGAVTVADGADVALGATSDAAVVTDTTGTVSGKLRGLVKWAFERMPASLGQKTMAASLPVVVSSDQGALSVTGPLTDAQLRAVAVPVSAASLPLPTGAATAALQLPDGHNVTVDNASLAITAAALPLPSGAAASALQLPNNHDVTANAGTNLNTLLLALESGGNLDDIVTALTVGPVPISGSISATSAATATEADPEYVEGTPEALSQDLGGRLRMKAYGTVADAPPTFIPGATVAISLTNDGRLRVASADARVADAPFSDDMRTQWGDLRPWENGSKPYFEASPWAAW